MVKIKIIGESKGSNPGATCLYEDGRDSFEGYIKYCPGTTLPRNYPFNPQNQPVYEALTSEMARYLQLDIPKTFVLIGGNNIEFLIDKNTRKSEWDRQRKYYFLSKKVDCSFEGSSEEGERKIADQEIYLELLKITDIVGRKQNWIYCPSLGGLFYLDVGCGVIQAHGGKISMKTESRRYFETSEKDLKRAQKNLRRYYLALEKTGDLVCLESILESIREIKVSTKNPAGASSLDDLISREEIGGLVKILALNMERKIRDLERSYPNKIIKINSLFNV